MFNTDFLHPMIVHFPIALLLVGFLSEIIGLILKKDFFTKTAFYLLILGTLGVVAAYISGDITGEGIAETGALKNALEMHEEAAQLSLWLMTAAAITRIGFVLWKKYSGVYKWFSLVLFLVGVLSIVRTGYYGGELVYKHAAGVQLTIGFSNAEDTNQTNNSEDDD